MMMMTTMMTMCMEVASRRGCTRQGQPAHRGSPTATENASVIVQHPQKASPIPARQERKKKIGEEDDENN